MHSSYTIFRIPADVQRGSDVVSYTMYTGVFDGRFGQVVYCRIIFQTLSTPVSRKPGETRAVVHFGSFRPNGPSKTTVETHSLNTILQNGRGFFFLRNFRCTVIFNFVFSVSPPLAYRHASCSHHNHGNRIRTVIHQLFTRTRAHVFITRAHVVRYVLIYTYTHIIYT